MTLGQDLTHDEVLRLANRAGALVRELHGTPDLVVSIARSGTAIGVEFGRGAGAPSGTVVTCTRSANLGRRGTVRKWIRRHVPLGLRQFYRRLFFRPVIRWGRRMGTHRVPVIDHREIDALQSRLDTEKSVFVAVVDDAIDSGGTAEAVLRAIQESGGHHRSMLFALTTTAGVVVQDAQLTLFEDVIEYADGDVAQLLLRYRPHAVWDRRPHPADQRTADRRLYLDLDGTLVANSFSSAYRVLLRRSLLRNRWTAGIRLLSTRALRRLRLVGHRSLERRLDAEIRRLDQASLEAFHRDLAVALRKGHRSSLTWLARAPRLRTAVVTAALEAYRPAIEQAFGFPVLTATGPDERGNWRSVSAADKGEAIERDLAGASIATPALLLGDTLTDAMVASARLQVAIVPPWDRTGVLTLLGTTGWWSPAAAVSKAQDRTA